MKIENWYVSDESKYADLVKNEEKPRSVSDVVADWAQEFKLRVEEIQEKLGDDHTAEGTEKELSYWLSQGVHAPDRVLKGVVVLGKRGYNMLSERIGVSSELAENVANKLIKGEDFGSFSKAEKMSALVFAKAQLMAVKDIALDVYPALQAEFDQSENSIDRVLNDLLQDKKIVLDKKGKIHWSNMVPAGKAAVPVLLVMAVMVSSACGPVYASGGEKRETTPGATQAVEVEFVEAQLTAPSLITTDSTVSIYWIDGYAEMTLDGKSVYVPVDGFRYEGDGPNNVKMSRENITVTVDAVSVKFVANGHGDSLDMVVEYESSGNTFSYRLDDAGQSLSLSKAEQEE